MQFKETQKCKYSRYMYDIAPFKSGVCCVCRYELSAVASSTLTSELESCLQLHELEPDNKCKYSLPLCLELSYPAAIDDVIRSVIDPCSVL